MATRCDLHRRVGVGINLSVPRELADHAIHGLDRIGGVNRLADRPREVEQRNDVRPAGTPCLDDFRTLGVSRITKFVERLLHLDHAFSTPAG